MRSYVSTVVSSLALVSALGVSTAYADVITFSEDDVATGVYKYKFDLTPGQYSIALSDLSGTFSYLGLTVGQGATNYGALVLNGTSDYGLFTFTVPTGVDASYSAIVYGKTLVAGDFSVVVTSVPEPAMYGMLAAGLGLIGWTARRKRV